MRCPAFDSALCGVVFSIIGTARGAKRSRHDAITRLASFRFGRDGHRLAHGAVNAAPRMGLWGFNSSHVHRGQWCPFSGVTV